MMNLSPSDWHTRLQQQAKWTSDLRNYLFQKSNILAASNICDFGSGTGTIIGELSISSKKTIVGIDIDLQSLSTSIRINQRACVVNADGFFAPFMSNIFDITFCHYFLLWINNPLDVLNEMVRVTRTNGYVLAIAEPDYGGQIYYPNNLQELGILQQESLRLQGADPLLGRKLKDLFQKAKLVNIEVGIMGAIWTDSISENDLLLEWNTLISDLDFLRNKSGLPVNYESSLEHNKSIWYSGERIHYVPTFFAIGQVQS
jgi:ubiquinone/menaquinone biosynthesis C-methylase UbiE